MPHTIHNQLDFILFEEGSFSPLNWLLREGHLDYSAYQNWKKGTSRYLEDHFKTPITTLITTLKAASDYARSLQLKPSRQTYLSTESHTLHFCRSPAHEIIFTTIYEPADDRMQMDLFFDSADTCAVSNLISAIVDGCSVDIAGLMAKLKPLNPDKYQHFKTLLAYEQKINQSDLSSAQKIEVILQKITPLAFDLLGRFTLDFLTPEWHTLSEEVADLHFDADNPNNHLSFTAFKEFQWQQVLTSIEQEKNWSKQPLLIFRYAESCFKLDREREGIEYWFSLFIQFPEKAEQQIKNSCHRLLYTDWQSFSELDPELESSLFPAWLIMTKPALAQNTLTSEINNEPLQLITKLVCNTERVINETAIQLRVRLQQNSPFLFKHYMRTHPGAQP